MSIQEDKFFNEVTEHYDKAFSCITELMPTYNAPDVYHYTSQPGLLGILQERSLWATDIRFLNDDQEFRNGVSILDAVTKEVMDPSHLKFVIEARQSMFIDRPSYVICFTGNGDSTPQWKSYGDYAVGWKNGVIANHFLEFPSLAQYLPCVYRRDDKTEIARRFLQSLNESVASGSLSEKAYLACVTNFYYYCAAFMKSEHFEDEQELRIVAFEPFQYPGEGKFSKLAWKARSGSRSIIPYLSVPIVQPAEIVMGPKIRSTENESALASVLPRLGAKDTKITMSSSPFR